MFRIKYDTQQKWCKPLLVTMYASMFKFHPVPKIHSFFTRELVEIFKTVNCREVCQKTSRIQLNASLC